MPTVDGIVSGIDTTSLISAILSPQQVTIDTLNSRIAQTEDTQSAVATFSDKLTALSDAIKDMNTPSLFQVNTATTNSSQFTVTADSDALPGTYSIQVTQLAASQISQSAGFDDADAAVLGLGTFAVTVGATTTNLTIDGTNNNFTALAEALNEVDGISAYVLDTGAAVGRYRLIVQGEDTGAANTFSFDESALVGGTESPSFATSQTAVDAHLVVAGVTVFIASNSSDAIIPGLTLNLLGVGATADSAVVSRDSTAMQGKLQAVVDAYNAIVDDYELQTVFNAEAGIRGPLVGEGTTRSALADLSSMITNRFTVAGTTYTSLAELGFETEQDGQLSFDATVFQAAYDADPDAVTTFLTAETGALTSVSDRIDDLYVDETDGLLASRDETLQGIIEDLQEQVEKNETRLTSMAAILRDRFNAMEQTLSRIQATGAFIDSLFPSTSNQS
jgi:flagellar hook-associated protein 2